MNAVQKTAMDTFVENTIDHELMQVDRLNESETKLLTSTILQLLSINLQTIDRAGQVCVGFIKFTHLHYLPSALDQSAVEIFFTHLPQSIVFLKNQSITPKPYLTFDVFGNQ